MENTEIYPIENQYIIGKIRRDIINKCGVLGFSENEKSQISIVISELCENIIKHNAIDGKIIFKVLGDELVQGIEIVSEDKGPGIADIDQVLQDGFSTSGTLGGGLGAVKRLMDSFEIYSKVNEDMFISYPMTKKCIGTIIIVKKWINRIDENKNLINRSVMTKPYMGSQYNGDAYYIKSFKDREILSVIDGLGHGLEACKVASVAVKAIEDNNHKSALEIINSIDINLKSTRGAVAAVLSINKIEKKIECCSVGNIDISYIYNNVRTKVISTNGVLGTGCTNIKSKYIDYQVGGIIIICSDGISNKWNVEDYQFESLKNPAILSNLIMRDYALENDDSTVMVAFL